jgi:hypothetical protein
VRGEAQRVEAPLHVVEPEEHRPLGGDALDETAHQHVALGGRAEAHERRGRRAAAVHAGRDQLGEGAPLVVVGDALLA